MLTKKEPTKNETKTTKAVASPKQTEPASEKKFSNPIRTRLTIKFDVGFPNAIYIRGKGANLSWEKGQLLTNTKPDEWVWETDLVFNQCEFKVLINDKSFEQGDNHLINNGASLVYTPRF